MLSRIYGLVDPRTGEIRYVGQTTTDLNCRLRSHLSEARTTSSQRYSMRWMRAVLAAGLRPEILELEVGGWSTELRDQRERDWISRLPNLTNSSPGGYSHGPLSEDTKLKLREATLRQFSDPIARAKHAAASKAGMMRGSKLGRPLASRVTLTCAMCPTEFAELEKVHQRKLSEGQVKFYCSRRCASRGRVSYRWSSS